MTANVDDPRARLTRKIEPLQIRLTLMHASLMQLVHELIKQWVVKEVKAFYGYDEMLGDGSWLGEGLKASYERDVLALAPGSTFGASALWLEQAGAITRQQRERLDDIYAYRHELAHEVIGFIVDVERTPDATMLVDALAISSELDRFWKNIDRDIGVFDDHGDVDIDNVHSGRALVLQLCVDAYLSGERPDAAGE